MLFCQLGAVYVYDGMATIDAHRTAWTDSVPMGGNICTHFVPTVETKLCWLLFSSVFIDYTKVDKYFETFS